MIKIIDIDALFDKYIEKYVYENIGKIKPDEIEDKIADLYKDFGDKPLDELGGRTPNTFYREYASKELLDCLKEHVEKEVAVSDFLLEAIIASEDGEKTLVGALDYEECEEMVAYIMNMLSDMGAKVPVEKYLGFALWDYPDSIGELATEILCNAAEEAKEAVLAAYKDAAEDKKPRLTEILSNVKGDDRVFDILVAEFAKNTDNIPLYASYLAKYGDERALPFLMTAIEGEKISYADFEELRFAIEALGGKYDKERDFSQDKTYKKIKGGKNNIKRA